MNRLIIVGNGFDLAHGLRTSYCDFIEDYLVEALNTFAEKNYFEDPLLQITHIDHYRRYTGIFHGKVSLENLQESLRMLGPSTMTRITYKSSILAKSLEQMKSIRWVDLENMYFDELLECRLKAGGVNAEEVLGLNLQFDSLKSSLEKYLTKIQFDLKSFKKDPNIEKIFRLPVSKDDIIDYKSEKMSINLRHLLFLNFNYTNTLLPYTKRIAVDSNTGGLTHFNDKVNHIHGELDNDKNPIVFGFGDEYDKNYAEFEEFKNNEVFRHIKSFAYFKTKNYHDLVRFLSQSHFQVFIIGHSCGLSDRTMFREIFEHENCASIKIFYYEKEDKTTDFVDKTFDIARHFTNKGDMRKKIVSEPNSQPFPQYSIPSKPIRRKI